MDADFARLNEAQFAKARKALQSIGRAYIYYVAEELIALTPGFGNQAPPDTEYIPTGRLRGGWNLTREPILQSTKGLAARRNEDGPFSDYGAETLARIVEQLKAETMGGISYLENDVGYGDIIRVGKGRHRAVGPRDWPKQVEVSQATFAAKAVQTFGAVP